MRRLLAILLVCLLGSALPAAAGAALLTADSAVPACCRAHGAHRCILGTAGPSALSTQGIQLRAPGCPMAHSQPAVLAPRAIVSNMLAQAVPPTTAAPQHLSTNQPRAPEHTGFRQPRAPPSFLPS